MSEKNNLKNIEINSLILPNFGCKVQAVVFTRENSFMRINFYIEGKLFLIKVIHSLISTKSLSNYKEMLIKLKGVRIFAEFCHICLS